MRKGEREKGKLGGEREKGDHSIMCYEIGRATVSVTRWFPCALNSHEHRRVPSAIRRSAEYVNR